MTKRVTALLLSMVLVFSLFTGCGTKKDSTDTKATQEVDSNVTTVADKTDAATTTEKVHITVMTNVIADHAAIIEQMARDFEAENPNVTIGFSAPGGDYENIMKVKMAANDMPDVFSTHGWAKARYGEFLADLSGRAWASQVVDSFKPIVTDESGKLYILPFDQDQAGPIYNKEIFDRFSLEVPTTFDEFMAVCEVIKTQSNGDITPIASCAEGWEEAQFFDFFATALLTSAPSNESAALLDQSFDWTKWDFLPERWLEMQKKGYINEDFFTAKFADNVTAFATGKAAIGLYGPFFIEEGKKINPDLKADMMPIPSIVPGDTPTFAGGEKTTLGVWKDSPNLEIAMQFVDFCAKNENVDKVCAYTKLPPAIKGSEINAGDLTETYKKYADIRVLPYFDRVYLPNGMWDVMCSNSQSLLGGGITPREFSQNMETEFIRLNKIK